MTPQLNGFPVGGLFDSLLFLLQRCYTVNLQKEKHCLVRDLLSLSIGLVHLLLAESPWVFINWCGLKHSLCTPEIANLGSTAQRFKDYRTLVSILSIHLSHDHGLQIEHWGTVCIKGCMPPVDSSGPQKELVHRQASLACLHLLCSLTIMYFQLGEHSMNRTLIWARDILSRRLGWGLLGRVSQKVSAIWHLDTN